MRKISYICFSILCVIALMGCKNKDINRNHKRDKVDSENLYVNGDSVLKESNHLSVQQDDIVKVVFRTAEDGVLEDTEDGAPYYVRINEEDKTFAPEKATMLIGKSKNDSFTIQGTMDKKKIVYTGKILQIYQVNQPVE